MVAIAQKSPAWSVTAFALVMVVLMGLAAALRFNRNDGVRYIDFSTMQPGERAVFFGDTRQSTVHKLHFLETGKRYDIGIFGDHTVSLFAEGAFPDRFRGRVFNYNLKSTSLPEVLDIVRYSAAVDRLPELLIVQVDNPFPGAGRPLFAPRTDLGHFAFYGLKSPSWLDKVQLGGRALDYAINWTKDALDWRSIWSNLLSPVSGPIIMRPEDCSANLPPPIELSRWARFLPTFAQTLLRLRQSNRREDIIAFICRDEDYSGVGGDGSEVGRRQPAQLEMHNWPAENALRPWHAAEIAANIKEIDRIVTQANRRVIFAVPPVYMGPKNVPVDIIFSRAMKAVPDGIKLIDNRSEYQDPKFFHGDDEHPGLLYYRALVQELMRRGWLN